MTNHEPDWDDLMASLGLAPSGDETASCACAGTRTAYQQHRRRGEEPCPDSRAANAAYLRARRGGGMPRRAPECGTYGGYQSHHKRGEEACDRCVEARRVRDREAYAARKRVAA